MRPSWWIPPRITKYQYTATPAQEATKIPPVEDRHSADPEDREAERLVYEARQQAKRLNRRETYNEDAAVKFRKDLEVARRKMRKFEEEYAIAREAAKNKPKLHSGGGNWGRYEYVWEEEGEPGQSSKVTAGSKRSNRATSFANSPPRLSKRRRVDESTVPEERPKASTSRYGRERKATHKVVANGSSPGHRLRPEAKEHPAKRRTERARPPGPIFSAIPPSPSKEIIAENDFDIMPLPDMSEAVTPGQTEDIYDSDVEIIASNVSCAVREGRLEEEYGSNVNPISLEGEEDTGTGDHNAHDENDISYSAHFDASAPHLMPVTPGSVNEGGVPEGTSSDKTTGTQSFPRHPNYKNKKGISPLESREIFRGTLSSPDTHSFDNQYVVRPESYQSPRALLERGKGTRAAIIAQERNLSGKTLTPAEERRKTNPLLYSAEAEIARARQVAAFLESAQRRKARKPLTRRHVHFSRSPRLSSPRKSTEPGEHSQGQEENSDSIPDTVARSPSEETSIPQLVDVASVPLADQRDTDAPMPLVSDDSTVVVEHSNAQSATPEAAEEEHPAMSPPVVIDQELTVTTKAASPEPSPPPAESETVLETLTRPMEPELADSAHGQDTVATGPMERSEPDSTPTMLVDTAEETTLAVLVQPQLVQMAADSEANDIEEPTPLLGATISIQNEVEIRAISETQERVVETESTAVQLVSTEAASVEIAPEEATSTVDFMNVKEVDVVSFIGN